MSEILSALLVAAIGALTAFAYRQPEAYDRLSNPIQALIAMGVAANAAWLACTFRLSGALRGMIDPAKRIAAEQTVDGFTDDSWMIGGSLLAAMFYVNILRRLRLYLGIEEAPGEGGRDDDATP